MISPLTINNQTFDWGSRTYVMGILNATPDSFSGDGLMSNGGLVEQAVQQAEHFLKYGANMLDIGGESTRPGSQTVNADEEIERVIPVIQEIAKKLGTNSAKPSPVFLRMSQTFLTSR